MRFVAFLRAINVRGHPMIRMHELRAAFEAAGCGEVRSFIQSGNILFDADSDLALEQAERAVATFGTGARVFVRRLDALRDLAHRNPLDAYTGDRSLKLYVAFLSAPPAEPIALPIVDEKERLEIVEVAREEAFVVSRRKPSGIYGFPNNLVERRLGVTATARNWNTLLKLLAFAARG